MWGDGCFHEESENNKLNTYNYRKMTYSKSNFDDDVENLQAFYMVG
jgi:hypothetical protein